EAEGAKAGETVVEEAVDPGLERPVEVDEDVAAEDDLKLVEAAVLGEVVLGPDDVLAKVGVEERAVVGSHVVLGERAAAPGPDVVVGVLLHPVERIDACARLLEYELVDVGGVDAGPVVETVLAE